jgi:serine/threonine protein kinase
LVFGAVYPVVKLVQSRKHNNVQEKAQVVEPEPCLYLSDDAIVVSVHDDDDWFSKDWLSGMMPLGQYRHVSLKPLTEADMKFLDIKKMSRALYVHHPNVLSFQGLWKKGSAVYYVLEAVYSQQTFYQWINHPLTRSTLKLGDYIRLARSLCEGFEHLHEKDILLGEFSLHTVLVPASAFYGDSPDRVVQPRIAAGLSLVDNFNYIYALRPPESHEIETFTKFTDYWYMGLALWHVFDEGENPFSRVLSFSMVSDTIHKNFAIPLKPKYSTGPIHDFLNGCWQYSPEKRHIASTLKRFFVSLYEDLIRPGTFAFTEPDIELTTTVLKSRRHYENLSADTELTTTVLKSRRQYENISDDLYKENPPGHSENQ